jgi:mRNA-degrading endonuclease RelE of RelBE toxin-antitoxin system
VIKRVILSTEAQTDLAALDRPVALHILRAVSRVATTGVGNVQALHGIHPLEFRLRVGDWRVRFHDHAGSIEILRVRHRSEAYR